MESGEVLQLLLEIERGEVSLTALEDPQRVYSGEVRYRASNGLELVVFNDANQWDYLDSVFRDGVLLTDFDEFEASPAGQYQPSEEAAWRCYGIPGYLKFRCRTCGGRLRRLASPDHPFLCPEQRAHEVPAQPTLCAVAGEPLPQ
jgi:hypothetical protein